jgi:hypothetical protein
MTSLNEYDVNIKKVNIVSSNKSIILRKKLIMMILESDTSNLDSFLAISK